MGLQTRAEARDQRSETALPQSAALEIQDSRLGGQEMVSREGGWVFISMFPPCFTDPACQSQKDQRTSTTVEGSS